MAKKRADSESTYIRVTALVPDGLANRIEATRARLRAQGVRTSISGLVEIALLELLNTRNLADVLRKRGVKARRD